MMLPRRIGLFSCWLLGLLLDVLYGTPLGQHGLALVIGAFLIMRFSEYIRAYRLWQQGLLLLPIFLVYEFLLFWIDGLSGHVAEPLWRWAPAFTSALCWPPLCEFLRQYVAVQR
jgi:rod shape-determining protein MreD